jgi:ribose-phosphate pyrophosphokinase
MQRRTPSVYGPIRLISGSGCPDLAQEVGEYLGVRLTGRDVIKFSNENIFVRIHSSMRGADVYLIQTMASPVNENLMELFITLDALKRDSAARITAVVPYLSYTRSDKKDQPRVPITARLIAEMIQVAGADRYVTVDLHAGQIQGFFSIPGDELTAIHTIIDYLRQKTFEDLVVVTADLGFAKTGRNYAARLDGGLAFVEKRRPTSGGGPEALTVIGDVRGKDVMIVDDEVNTAGSIAQAVQLVKSHGARDVYLSFTHPVLSGPAVDRLRSLPLKEIVTTNTLPIPSEKRLPNMTVLSVAPMLGEVILRAHEGRSVGALFNE